MKSILDGLAIFSDTEVSETPQVKKTLLLTQQINEKKKDDWLKTRKKGPWNWRGIKKAIVSAHTLSNQPPQDGTQVGDVEHTLKPLMLFKK